MGDNIDKRNLKIFINDILQELNKYFTYTIFQVVLNDNIIQIAIYLNKLFKGYMTFKYSEQYNKFIIDGEVFNYDKKELSDKIFLLYYNYLNGSITKNYKKFNNFTELYNDIIEQHIDKIEQFYKYLPDFDKEKIEYLINAKKFDLI